MNKCQAGTRRYFEGWYFKHQNSDTVLSIIPGLSVDNRGKSHAFIQLITGEQAHCVYYPSAGYLADHKGPSIRIHECRFSTKGITLKIDKPGFQAEGSLRYGPFTPLNYDIMGPFARLPAMECRHGIVSLLHPVRGTLTVNGKGYCFDNGLGYIERDWGRSFPKRYRWIQGAGPEKGGWCAFASSARIPYLGLRFTGCIAVLYYEGHEYRFATYNGAHAQENGRHGLTFIKGRRRLELTARPAGVQKLLAPQLGQMSRVVHEAACCPVTIRLWEGGTLVFEASSAQGGFEATP